MIQWNLPLLEVVHFFSLSAFAQANNIQIENDFLKSGWGQLPCRPWLGDIHLPRETWSEGDAVMSEAGWQHKVRTTTLSPGELWIDRVFAQTWGQALRMHPRLTWLISGSDKKVTTFWEAMTDVSEACWLPLEEGNQADCAPVWLVDDCRSYTSYQPSQVIVVNAISRKIS